MSTPDTLTTGQVAALLAVSTSTVKRWAASGELPYRRTFGGHLRFERAAIEQAAARHVAPKAS